VKASIVDPEEGHRIDVTTGLIRQYDDGIEKIQPDDTRPGQLVMVGFVRRSTRASRSRR